MLPLLTSATEIPWRGAELFSGGKNSLEGIILLHPTSNKPYCLDLNRIKLPQSQSSCCGSVVMNLTSIHEDVGLLLGPPGWVKDPALL